LGSLLNGEIIGNSFLDSGEDNIFIAEGANITGMVIQEPSSSKPSKKGGKTCGNSCPNKGKGGKAGGKMPKIKKYISTNAFRHNGSGSDAPGRRVLTKWSH
jgi:hypothetical protein